MQEERLRTAHHQVVHDHSDQVKTHRIVDLHLAGNVNLGTNTVGGGCQQRLLVVGAEGEKAGEAA